MAKHDWDILRNEYITSNISVAKLSEKYNVPYSTIKDRAAKEKWIEQRDNYAKKTTEKTVEKMAEKVASINLESLSRELDLANNLSRILAEAMNDELQFRRYIIKNKKTLKDGTINNTVEEMIFEKYDFNAIEKFASTLENIVDIKWRIYGLLTEAEKQRLEILKSKLNINIDEEGNSTGIVLLPCVDLETYEKEKEKALKKALEDKDLN